MLAPGEGSAQPGVKAADEVGELTAHGQPALYHPDARGHHERERVEMVCVACGIPLGVRRGIRCYYIRMDDVIGFSDGEATCYVYAEWSMDGEVHGRPITRQELIRKGANREALD